VRAVGVAFDPIRSDSAIRGAFIKALGLLLVGGLIGTLDDVQVRYVDFAGYGTSVEIVYQACFMAAAAVGAYAVLRRTEWGVLRNLSTLIMAIPVATIADNVSIDLGTMRPYVLFIPSQGYDWRPAVFAHTTGLDSVSELVNQQTFAPGILDGYVAAIVIAASYVLMRYALHRHTRFRTHDGRSPVKIAKPSW
jgi:hypothetical protein